MKNGGSDSNSLSGSACSGGVAVEGVNPASGVFVLSILYFLLSAVVAFQLSRILWYKHDLKSFQFGFLSLCFVWGIFRAIYFLLFGVLPPTAGLVLFATPYPIQFATFSLLVVFYAQVLHSHEWQERKRVFKIMYLASNGFFIMCFFVLLGLFLGYGPGKTPDMLTKFSDVFIGLIFFVLMCIMAWYGFRVIDMVKKDPISVPLRPVGHSAMSIVVVTVILFATFTFRTLFDVLTVSGVVAVCFDNSFYWNDIVSLVLYLVWEILPVSLVLYMFWDIPSTRMRLVDGDQSSLLPTAAAPPTAYQIAVNYGKKNRAADSRQEVSRDIFDDPMRYDSDTETHSLRDGETPPTLYGTPFAPYSTTPLTEESKYSVNYDDEYSSDSSS
eukprot:CAMPEP_0177638428 /NCGR_PEP_ID=MMETSP0447-20121125/5484_1 /TAXON_ID=0 /ORGANISM="Stygamoeba regulata, Strain BSH-02190019" /LENGTH=383 /DNA_ID=CAMNT_0019140391 /DNA_START=1522 /DNA_END=2673 /DNA_ORIENTATION=-